MNLHKYPQPFIPVSGGVVTSGYLSDLEDIAGSVSVGLYDADNFTVATGSGNSDTFVIGYSSEHTRDSLDKFIHGMKAPKKSMPFKGSDIQSLEFSNPQLPKSEYWTLGYNGTLGCDEKSPVFECGKTYGIRIVASGSPIFRQWAGQLEHEIYVSTPLCSDSVCTSGCPDGKVDGETVVRMFAEKFNNHIELKNIGLQVKYITSTYTAPGMNLNKYQISVPDAGDDTALAAVQGIVKGLGVVNRIGRNNVNSVYEVVSASAPGNFTPSTPFAVALCGSCPSSGFTTVAAKDNYIVVRPLAGTEDLTDAAHKATYAGTIATAYSATATFLTQNGATASVKISVAKGTTVAALLSDTLVPSAPTPALCTPTAATPIAWAQSGTAYRRQRSVCMTLPRKDCSGTALDRLAELQAYYATDPRVVAGSVTGTAGDGCNDSYTLTQWSDNFGEDGCLASTTFTFSDVDGYEGQLWKPVPVADVAYDANKKVGLEFTATLPEKYFSDCAMEMTDFYETEPINLEISWITNDLTEILQEEGFNKLPRAKRVRYGNVKSQSGEWLVREYIKAGAYEWMAGDFQSPRMREILDSTRRKQVDRLSQYKLYYLTYKVKRKNIQFDQVPEICEAVIAFKQGDPKIQQFEAAWLPVLAKFNKTLKERK